MGKGSVSDEGFFRKFAERTTLHGVRPTSDRDYGCFRRSLWIVFLVMAIAIFVYAVVGRIQFFLRYPTETKENVLDVMNLKFPALTVCNANKIRKSYAQQFPFLEKALRHVSAGNSQPGDKIDLKNDTIRNELKKLKAATVFKDGRQGLAEMLVSCWWDGAKCNDMFTETSTPEGSCYTFNSAELIEKQGPLMLNRTGIKAGLRLTMDVAQQDYILSGDRFWAGVQVLLHDPDVEPKVDLGFTASPGFTTFANFKTVQMERLPQPYGMCEGSSNSLTHYPKYSKAACQLECERNYLVERCGCLPPGYKGKIVEECDMLQFVECVSTNAEIYRSMPESGRTCSCGQRCVETYYTQQLSTAVSTSQAPLSNVLDLVVYTDRLSYQTQPQTAVQTVSTLLADIGIYIVICLGASILTLVELVEFFVLGLVVCCKRLGKGKKNEIPSTIAPSLNGGTNVKA